MKNLIFFLSLIVPVVVLSQQVIPSSAQNYTQKIVYKKGFTENNVDQATNGDKIESIQYFDGLGRPIQSVAVKQGGNNKDVITHIEYDAYGRQVKDYLPIPGSNNNGKFTEINVLNDINSYYHNEFSGEWNNSSSANPYSEKQLENSPLNRVLKQAAPGEDWKLGNGHEIEFDYQTNIAGEVKLYSVTLTSDYSPTLVGGTATYTANELFKNITKDENHSGTSKNHTTEEFKDKQGKVVLKRTYADINGSSEKHDTYYVYDDYGNLIYVLPPKSEADDNKPSSSELNELCYQYRYDSRNRLIEKKIPGKGREYIVYNKIDQPVLTQNSIQYNNNQWLFTKYDAFGRVAYTGLKNVSNTSYDRIYFQNLIDNSTSATQFENKASNSFSVNGTPVFYTKTAIPEAMNEIYTINYYDAYIFDLPTGLSSTITTSFGVTSTTNVKGLPTGSKVRVLGSSSWITTVTYYDGYKRPIYIYSKNDYLGTTDIVESKFIEDGYTNDIRGLVHETKTTHKKTGKTDIVTIDKFTYDHSGKMLTQTDSIAGQIKQYIAINEYDELGQLKRKKVGGTLNNELQVVDYTYNIRGWLKQINDVNNLGTTDLFAFNINYNDIADVNKRLYNGNISQTNWNSASLNDTGNPESNQYTYTYDALNRITSGVDNTGNYNLTNVAYDKNGNITNLERKGHTNTGATNFGVMDDLTYSYDSGNRLMKVADAATIDQFGFKDDAVNTAADTTDDYSYDQNGNLLTDTNKGITSILYNHMNMPTEIKFDNSNTKKINYTYDASGLKLKKVVNDGGVLTTTEYSGNFVYENNTLQFFNHPEGYVHNDNGTFKYVYNYLDHLGSIRLSYSDGDGNGSISQSEIIKENHYYPYGLKLRGFNTNVSSLGNSVAKKYMFNGKEFDDSFNETLNTYDFGARNYDPALGRWMNLDPLAEQMRRHSPYNYAFNNPIYFIDPDGMAPEDWYLNLETGDYEWYEGSEEKDGYENLGSSTNLVVGDEKEYSLNEDGSFTDNKTGKEYDKGESLEIDPDTNITSNLNTVEKISKLGSDFVAPFLELPQDIIFPIVNQANIIINEGVHEGQAENNENVVFPNTYQFKNWSFEKGRSTQSTGNPTYEEGLEIINNTIDVVATPVKLVKNPVTNTIIKSGGKKIIKKGFNSLKK